MDLPRYYIIGARPVKFVETADGGLDVLVYDWGTGKFQRDISYLTVALEDVESDQVSESEFNERVAKLRRGGK